MTEDELEPYHEIILDIIFKSGERLSGLLRDTVTGDEREFTTQRHFIPNGKVTFYKMANVKGDLESMKEIRSVIDIRDIDRVMPIDAKYGLKFLREEIAQYPSISDENNVRNLVENFIVRTFGNNSHYIQELHRIMESHYGWIGDDNHLSYTIGTQYKITLYNIGKLLDSMEDSIVKFSNYEEEDNDLDIKEVWEESIQVASDIINIYKEEDKSRTAKTEGLIHILIASPSDVKVARLDLLERMETRFRVKGFEEICGKRIIVHGWEELPSQSGHGQSLINNQLVEQCDIIVAVFRHRLGTPVIDPVTKEERSASGTAEELLLAIRNEKSKSAPLGMAYFYQEAPVVSMDAMDFDRIRDEWTKLKEFKNSIKDEILYQTFKNENEVLDMVCEDLCKNIKMHFQ